MNASREFSKKCYVFCESGLIACHPDVTLAAIPSLQMLANFSFCHMPIAILTVTSPIVINVPTRELSKQRILFFCGWQFKYQKNCL